MKKLFLLLIILLPFISKSNNLPDTTDLTAQLNSQFADPGTQKVILNCTGTSCAFRILGTVQAKNKILEFSPGAYMYGGGTINQAAIDAQNYRSQILDTSIRLTNCATANKMFSVMWYGAKADGIQDDQPFLQKTSDMMIVNTSMVRNLYLPQGNYKLNSSWILYSWSGSNYRVWNLNIIGQEEIQNTNNSSNPRILPTFTDAPAIIVQFAYGGYIKGLSIEGKWNPSMSQVAFYLSNFSQTSTSRNSQFSPNAGICIDAFSSQPPSDGGYPSLLAYYRGPKVVTGSSDFHIYQCRIQGFTVDIMNTPNGSTQQGEDCTIEHCTLNNANVGVAYGNTQSDHTALIDTRSWYYVYTIVDNFTYGGAGVGGTLGRIQGMNVAGYVKRIFNLSMNQKTLSVRDIYAEGVYEFGVLQSVHDQVTLENCHLNYASLPIRPEFNATFANINITGCTFKYYDDLYNKRMIFNNGNNTRFVNCYFDQPPLVLCNQPTIVGYARTGADFVDCVAFDPTNSSNAIIGMHNDIYRLSNTTSVPVAFGKFQLQDFTGLNSSDLSTNNSQVIPFSTVTYDYNCSNYNRYLRKIAINAMLNIDSVSRSATFTTSFINQCRVNDYCLNNSNGSNLGRITKIQDSTITISEIPDNISSGIYTIDMVYYLTVSRPFVGDVTAGSNIITSMVPTLNYPYARPGDRIDVAAFPMGTYIVTFNTNGRTVTVSAPATINAKQMDFANGDPQMKIKSLKAPGLVGGTFGVLSKTIWEEVPNIFSTGHNQSIFYKCVKGGVVNAASYFFNGSNLADFFQVCEMRLNAGVFQYYNPKTDSWINVPVQNPQ